MQDISATPLRSSRRATWLASCAALEQPEQEYTSGRSARTTHIGPPWPCGACACGCAGAEARQHLVGRPLLQIEHRQLQRIDRVLDDQAQFGVALHGQAAVEEQRVRVFLALRQAQKVVGIGADGQVGCVLLLGGHKAHPGAGEVKGQAGVASHGCAASCPAGTGAHRPGNSLASTVLSAVTSSNEPG